MGVEVGGGEGAGRQVGEPDDGVHDSQLAGVIQLDARHPLADGGDRGLREIAGVPAIDEGLQDVLLDVAAGVGDPREAGAEGGEVVDSVGGIVVGDVVGGGFGPQVVVIPDMQVAVVGPQVTVFPEPQSRTTNPDFVVRRW